MIDRKTISYGLLLLAVLLAGSMALSVGQTQAHYLNSRVWNTVVEAEGAMVTSDCLVDMDDAPLTVLLGELPEGKSTVAFTLESTRDVVGCLEWSVDQAKYLDVTMTVGEETLEQGGELALKKEAPLRILMTLEETKDPHEAMDVYVTVIWSGGLKGTFCVALPEMAAADIPGNALQNEDENGIVEETEPETEQEPTAEPEPATEPELSVPIGPPPANPGAQEQKIEMHTIDNFAPSAGLPVNLTLTEEVTHLLLGGGDGEIQPFPPLICYSLDNGNSYYMLYYGGILSIDPQESASAAVLLDFSRVEIDPETEILLTAQGYAEEALIGSASARVKPDVAVIYQMDTRLLTQEAPLEIALPEVWKDCLLEYSVEMLSAGGANVPDEPDEGYADTVWSPQSLMPGCVSDETEYKLIFRLDRIHPTAGTYRVTVNWIYEGISFAQAEITFFINYSQHGEAVSTGGADQ